jgi:hypothetical protein
MAKSMDVEQLPSSHHVEGEVVAKSELQVNVPEARQSLIRKQVGLRLSELEHLMADNTLQFDRRVLPIVCTLYVLSYLDRSKSNMTTTNVKLY